MRIVDVCAFYTPAGGGVRTYVDAKLKAASRLGHEIIVIAPGAREELVRRGPGAFVATIPSPVLPVDWRYRYFHDERALHRALDVWRPDHLEVSSPWSSATMAGRWHGAATRSLVMHCDPLAAYAYRWFGGIATTSAIDRLFGWFWRHLRRLDAMFDLVVCANRQLTQRLGRGGVGKAETVAMGVETGVFSPALRSPELRASVLQSFGLDREATLLIGVGRLSSEKRWDMAIRAVAAIAAAKPIGFILVGEGSSRPQLQRLAEKGGGAALVLPALTDRRELARLMASADALVHGCEAETFCMVAAEARASGIPLIVPDRGAAADQLVHGAGGAYSSGSQQALERMIGDFIDGGTELQRRRAALSTEVRTIDEHFGQLFDRYDRLRSHGHVTALSHVDGMNLVGGDQAAAPVA